MEGRGGESQAGRASLMTCPKSYYCRRIEVRRVKVTPRRQYSAYSLTGLVAT